MDSSDPPPNSKDPSGTVKRPAKAASVGNQLKRASVVRSDNAAGGSSGRDSIPGHSSRRARSSSRTAAGRRSGDNGTTADKVSFEAALRRLQELQPRSLPPAIPPSTPSTRRRSSSMPEPESVGLLLAPRPCYSASVSGTCTPTDYASSPSGPRSTGRELQPIKSTLSYLDLAASRATGENAAPPGVPELPESPSGSVTALVARTWAHDMSADARRNRTPSPGTDAATSGNTPSGLPTAYCTPAKVAIVVKLELMTDQPVTLRPLASTEHTSSGLLETSAFERAAARKQNRVSKKSQRFAGAISNATSEAVGCHSRPPASSSSSSSADGSSSKEPQGAPK